MRALLPLLALVIVLAGCEREEEPSLYRPGGSYQSALDARGKRIVVKDGADKDLGKWRERDGRLRVYDASMVALGEVGWEDEADKQRVRVTPTASDPIFLEKSEDGVWVLPSRLRLERVSNGWAVFDATSQRLGYVAEIEPGKFAVRDDYSSAPRAFARAGESSVKTPAGATVVSATPETSALLLLPYALEGLDNLTRAALALWLQHATTLEKTAPAADAPDAAAPDLAPSAEEVPDDSPAPQGPAQ